MWPLVGKFQEQQPLVKLQPQAGASQLLALEASASAPTWRQKLFQTLRQECQQQIFQHTCLLSASLSAMRCKGRQLCRTPPLTSKPCASHYLISFYHGFGLIHKCAETLDDGLLVVISTATCLATSKKALAHYLLRTVKCKHHVAWLDLHRIT